MHHWQPVKPIFEISFLVEHMFLEKKMKGKIYVKPTKSVDLVTAKNWLYRSHFAKDAFKKSKEKANFCKITQQQMGEVIFYCVWCVMGYIDLIYTNPCSSSGCECYVREGEWMLLESV